MYTRRDFPLLLIDEHYFQYNIFLVCIYTILVIQKLSKF